MGKLCEKRNYPNAEVKDVRYGSIVVVGSVAGGYGGMFFFLCFFLVFIKRGWVIGMVKLDEMGFGES